MASRRSNLLRAFRIADTRHPIFDRKGAMLYGETYAGALLEVLVHASGSVPQNQRDIEIEIPARLPIEEVMPSDVPGQPSNAGALGCAAMERALALYTESGLISGGAGRFACLNGTRRRRAG